MKYLNLEYCSVLSFFLFIKKSDKSGPPKGCGAVLLFGEARPDQTRRKFVRRQVVAARASLLSRFSATPKKFRNGVELNNAMETDGRRLKACQRHRQRTGLLDPGFYFRCDGRSPFGIVSGQGRSPHKALEFTEDLLGAEGHGSCPG